MDERAGFLRRMTRIAMLVALTMGMGSLMAKPAIALAEGPPPLYTDSPIPPQPRDWDPPPPPDPPHKNPCDYFPGTLEECLREVHKFTEEQIMAAKISHRNLSCDDPAVPGDDQLLCTRHNCAHSHFWGGCEAVDFPTDLDIELIGRGPLAGLTHNIHIPNVQTTAEHAPVTTTGDCHFQTNITSIDATAPASDSWFTTFHITAGPALGLPESPGMAEINRVRVCSGGTNPDQRCTTDSNCGIGGTCRETYNFYDRFTVHYRIDFVGKPEGPFAGMSGTFDDSTIMQVGVPFVDVPTLAPWGLVALVLLLLISGVLIVLRRGKQLHGSAA